MGMKFRDKLRLVSAKRYEPLLTDHRIDVMSMTMWLLLGLWGVLSTVASVTVLKDISEAYPIVWGSAIGVAALAAFIFALNTFATPPSLIPARIKWKRAEMISVGVLVGLIIVYPALMFISLFDGLDPVRPDLFALSLTYLVVPLWRIGHLAARIAQLRTVDPNA